MDVEFDLLYTGLSIHHLDREEIEYELKIRGLPFTETETRAALMRRLKDRLKEEKGANRDLEFERLNTTVDDEIKIIDTRVKQIKDFLVNKSKFDGIRESLKTRLVHYFARAKRLPDNTDKEEDLADIDSLIASIRGAFNTHFSLFSGQRDVIEQLNQSFSRMLSANNSAADKQNEEVESLVSSNRSSRRNLKSVDNPVASQNLATNFLPWMIPPWMFGNPQMQMWATQQMLGAGSLGNFSNQLNVPIGPGQVDNSNAKPRKSPRRVKQRVRSTSSESKDSSGTESGWPSDEPPKPVREKKRESKPRNRPVSDWRLKYDGADNGQNLMKFLKEVEFYAKSEDMSPKDLFRSAIHLFSGAAKTWFMTGFENEDFTSWEELKEELKREFLSPDHDHTSEIRAIARKQGPRETFQDYFIELQKIFNSLTKPMTERRKFEIVFRNMRADYKGHVVSSEIDNLADLKKFGRRLDATYWYKYQTSSNDANTRGKPSQVNEINTGTKPKPKAKSEEKQRSRTFHNSSRDRRGSEDENDSRPRKSKSPVRPNEQQDVLQMLVDKYKPLKDGHCFNCRLQGHHARDCDRPKHKYCQKCGFLNVDTASCPWCAKNASKTVPEGRQFDRQ
ncbi:uncharacterized protein LOC134291138 [Aedes albopictus]|uniref:CCHC-type domain-containing protein n=1 Tax=Aedes albopictus TaxID=7160 RepID=A0ABM1ZTK5_AEDAL